MEQKNSTPSEKAKQYHRFRYLIHSVMEEYLWSVGAQRVSGQNERYPVAYEKLRTELKELLDLAYPDQEY